MIEQSQIVADELLLTHNDFPSNFKYMAHPEDYKISKKPVYEKIFNKKAHHNRLLLRISWRIKEEEYIPMTFVCDTGAPMFFYLSPQAKLLLEKERIKEDELQNLYVVIGEKKATIQETPINHQPANVIGLLMLQRLGIHLTEEGFELDKPLSYL